VLSRPLTYIEWAAASTDGNPHDVGIYFDASTELVVNTADQAVAASRFRLDGQTVLRAGSREQATLAKRGDDLRIDWGYLYLAADRAEGVSEFLGNADWRGPGSTQPDGCRIRTIWRSRAAPRRCWL